MTTNDLALIRPLLIVAITIVAVMMSIAIRRSHRLTALLALAGVVIALVTLIGPPSPPATVSSLLAVDTYGRVYGGLVLAATAAVILLSIDYLDRRQEQREEYYLLLLLAALGSLVLVSAVHFVSFFLGLELLSVPLYGLIAYPRTREEGIEAGIKYLVLAAASAAFLLFGMALVYAETGTLAFARIAVAAAATPDHVVLLVGVGLIIVGFGFKLALVPFHLWTPDVYQGAPAPVTAFIATVSKGAMFALLLRFFGMTGVPAQHSLFTVFVVLAAASMIGGNLLALLQNNVKRLLAYSSIAHLGYLLVALLAGGPLAVEAVTFYLVAYFITTIGAFGIVTIRSTGDAEADALNEYRGLAARHPWEAGTFTGMLLSLAGIPLTAGFVGKFYLTVAAGSGALWGLLVVMMVTSGIGLFYYLRVVVAMYMQPAAAPPPDEPRGVPLTAGVTLAVLAGLLVWLGVYPTPVLALVRAAAGL